MKSPFVSRNLQVKDAALVVYRAGSDLIGKAAFLVITVAAARRLSQEAFGIFSLASTVGWIAAIATDFGIQLHLARSVAQEPGRAPVLLRAWLRLRLATSAAAIAVTAAIVWMVPQAHRYGAAMVLLTTMYVVSGLVEFLHYFYRGLSRSDLESTLTLGQRVVTLALGLAVLWVKPDLTLLAAAMLVPVAGTCLYSVRLAYGLARKTSETEHAAEDAADAAEASKDAPENERPVRVAAEWRRDVMPIAAGVVLSALYFRADVFLIEIWNGTGAVALYNAVFRLVEALRLLPAAVLAVALPVLCRATSAKPLRQVAALVCGLGVAATIACELVAPAIVRVLYGEPYAAAVPALRVLLLAFPLMSLNYALTHQLIGWNGHRAYAAICAAAFVFNIGLNALILPALSITGAAWATVWTEVLLSAGCIAALAVRAARPAAESAIAVEAS
jgi:O-antigen/teichoic acid export membrane protein